MNSHYILQYVCAFLQAVKDAGYTHDIKVYPKVKSRVISVSGSKTTVAHEVDICCYFYGARYLSISIESCIENGRIESIDSDDLWMMCIVQSFAK